MSSERIPVKSSLAATSNVVAFEYPIVFESLVLHSRRSSHRVNSHALDGPRYVFAFARVTEKDGSLGWDGECAYSSSIMAVVFSVAVKIEQVGRRGYLHKKSCARL